MGLFYSPYIFQENIFELFKGFNMVREYKDNVLVITRQYFTYHLKTIENVLHRIVEELLKVNTEKAFFV